jgi:hypothetical protein
MHQSKNVMKTEDFELSIIQMHNVKAFQLCAKVMVDISEIY